MKLPSIKFSLPAIFILWCVAGVAVKGPEMLAYPAMWAAIGLLFWGLHLATRRKTPSADSHAGISAPNRAKGPAASGNAEQRKAASGVAVS